MGRGWRLARERASVRRGRVSSANKSGRATNRTLVGCARAPRGLGEGESGKSRGSPLAGRRRRQDFAAGPSPLARQVPSGRHRVGRHKQAPREVGLRRGGRLESTGANRRRTSLRCEGGPIVNRVRAAK